MSRAKTAAEADPGSAELRTALRQLAPIARALEFAQSQHPLTSYLNRLEAELQQSGEAPATSANLAPVPPVNGQGLLEARASARLLASFDVLEDAVERELHQLELRRRILATQSARGLGADEERRARDLADRVRQLLESEYSQVELELTERIRKRTLPTSGPMNRISNLMEDLVPGDFSEEISGKTVRLRVGPDFRDRAIRAVRDLIEEQIYDDADWINTAREKIVGSVAGELSEGGPTATPGFPDLRPEEILEALRPALHLETRYHGELPQRTWMDRLSQGRRPVFALMMIASLAGAAFGIRSGLAAWLAPLLLLLFVGGFIWTFRSFEEERRQKIDRELLRVRETLGAELRRLLEGGLRESQARIIRWLRDAQRETTRGLDEQLRADQAELVRRNEQLRRDAQEKQRLFDLRLRELKDLDQQLGRIRTSVQLHCEKSRRALDSMAETTPSGMPGA